ncbi:MAG: outer membrane protein assembly factor BamA [Pararhodobacter sp.]|nr:outer membrane protein assembly factor BamA [Pararhodobacter sp.]
MRSFNLNDEACGIAGKAGAALSKLAIFLLIAVFSVSIAAVAEAQSYRFTTVAVEGNENIDDATVVGFARIARNRAMSASELNAAYQRVASTGFFRSVEFEPRGNRLVIRVDEYPIINRVNFEGNRRIDNDELRALVQSRAGAVYSPAQAEADATAIAEAYAARGRLAARITPRLIERGGGRVDVAFEVVEGRMVEFQRISFVGNRSFSDRRLRNAIETAQAGFASAFFRVDNYDEARIARDREILQDFYRSRGYPDAQVLSAVTELTRERDGAYVTFTIREGQQYRFGRIDVVSEIADIDVAPYRAEVSVRSGSLFTPTQMERLIERLERVAQQSGQRFVRAEPRLSRNERDQTIDVTMALVRGDRVFIERIDIQGNVTTQDNVIRRQFHVAEGDPLNPREIREAAARIRALGYFSQVSERVRSGSASDQAVVDVQVEETTTGSLGFGLSYGANEGVGGNLSFSETNFLGRGQSVSFNLSTVRNARSLDLSFTEPALMDRNLSLGLRLGYSTSTPSDFARFGSRVLQFSPSIGFPLSRYGRLSLRTTIKRDQITFGDNVDDLNPPISDRIYLDEDNNDGGQFNTASLGLTYSFDNRRRGSNPDRGFIFRFSPDVAGPPGDRQWARATILAGYEQRIMGGDVVLRAEAEAGAVTHRSGPSRINERFSLNSDQMRGFRPYGMGPRGFSIDEDTGERIYSDGLGGNYFAVARFEAEFPIGLPQEYNINGGLFLDVGSLWGIDAPTDNVEDSQSIRAAAGVSLFWDSPFGPLRFNFSHPLRREEYDRTQRFDLTLATRF